MRKTCVIDNSTLVNFTLMHDLRIFFLLRSIFDCIHVPETIVKEYSEMARYEPVRKNILKKIKLHGSSFLVHCNKHDSISFQMLATVKGIDRGEAEAVAQRTTLQAQLVLSDDKKFTKHLKRIDRHITVFTSLHILAWLDAASLFQDPKPYFKALHKRIRFTNVDLRQTCIETYKYLGLALPKSLQRKLTLSRFGIHNN